MRSPSRGLTKSVTKPLQRCRLLSELRSVALQITNPNGLLLVDIRFRISCILFDASDKLMNICLEKNGSKSQ